MERDEGLLQQPGSKREGIHRGRVAAHRRSWRAHRRCQAAHGRKAQGRVPRRRRERRAGGSGRNAARASGDRDGAGNRRAGQAPGRSARRVRHAEVRAAHERGGDPRLAKTALRQFPPAALPAHREELRGDRHDGERQGAEDQAARARHPRIGALNHAIAAALLAASLAACGPQRTAGPAEPEYRGFGAPQRVAIRGYSGDAMEPFITRDGRWLLFNNRNDPRTDTNLHFAERVDDVTFDYRGELRGANSPALDGVASMDRDGNLYFVSTRSYAQTLSTLYRGRFRAGTVSNVELLPGVSLRRPGMLIFDAEIAPAGDVLFLVDGEFAGGPNPKSADIAIAVREGAGFRRLPEGAAFLRNVNTPALEY